MLMMRPAIPERFMPVTAKLSRHFYEQLGDDVANELVEWFNAVDATYRAELQALNELNWDRFRAELRGGIAELRAELLGRNAELRAELLKWMFVFWAGTIIPLASLILGLAIALR